jgi:hypothetical protein
VTAPTRLDASTRSLVAWCVACPSWRRVDSDRARILRETARHLDLVHGQPVTAAKHREQATRIDGRHAEP